MKLQIADRYELLKIIAHRRDQLYSACLSFRDQPDYVFKEKLLKAIEALYDGALAESRANDLED